MSQGFMSENDGPQRPVPPEKLDEIFNDFEARSNIVGFYDLLLKIDRRTNPHLYRRAKPPQSEHHEND